MWIVAAAAAHRAPPPRIRVLVQPTGVYRNHTGDYRNQAKREVKKVVNFLMRLTTANLGNELGPLGRNIEIHF